jgi:hypothetical protein
MQQLTINAGYEAEYTPRIVCSGQIGVDMTQQRTDLVQLVNAGLVTREDLGQDNIDLLITGLGFTVPDRVAPVPLNGGTMPSGDPNAQGATVLLDTRARRMPRGVTERIFDGLLRHEATPDVTISAELIASAREWVRGAVPTDDEVRAAMTWLASPDGRQALTSRAGAPEWLLSQVYGGRAGAAYWQGEYTRRGLAQKVAA